MLLLGRAMGWDVKDSTPVAEATSYMLSDLSHGITGEILHVDGGFHAMRPARSPGRLSGAGRRLADLVSGPGDPEVEVPDQVTGGVHAGDCGLKNPPHHVTSYFAIQS
jgi:Enoyl-(Acyl carrier protein) reductase